MRGLIRTLQTTNRRPGDLLPRDVQHKLFIPVPIERDSMTWEERRIREIPQNVLEQFRGLADMALAGMHLKKDEIPTEDVLLPFVPGGRVKDDRQEKDGFKTKLCDGDIVLFEVNDDSEISEISFSSLWREGVMGKSGFYTAADFVASVDPDLLPLGMETRLGSKPGLKREELSPAELLFGVVEDMGDRQQSTASEEDRRAFTFAGKVRIGYGLPAEDRTPTLLDTVTLKELSSPKPPSPAMYFHRKGGNGYVSKKQLAGAPGEYRLNGRKQYLHAARGNQGGESRVKNLNDQGAFSTETDGRAPWHSKFNGRNDEGNKRRVKVRPIAQNEAFYFEVDFDNLTWTELEQLCATLYPSKEHEHKLGMGKPLGLGSVKIEPVGLYLVDRQKRYAEDAISDSRYHSIWESTAEPVAKWPAHLRRKQEASTPHAAASPIDLAKNGMNAVADDAKKAILLLGNPCNVTKPVHYPQVANKLDSTNQIVKADIESENYLWFVANDEAKREYPNDTRQSLGVLGSEIPVLKRQQVVKPKKK